MHVKDPVFGEIEFEGTGLVCHYYGGTLHVSPSPPLCLLTSHRVFRLSAFHAGRRMTCLLCTVDQ